jgi:hypothetical protein
MRNKLVEDIRRLQQMDDLLRGDGANVPTLAEEWQTTGRAVHRYLDVLRELVGPTSAERYDDQHFRQTYLGKPQRLFSKL